MRSLSVFVDESGHVHDPSVSRFMLGLVFLDTAQTVKNAVDDYNNVLKKRKLPDIPFHANPLRSRRGPYKELEPKVRRALLLSFAAFVDALPITYTIICYKRKASTTNEAVERELTQQLCAFLQRHRDYLERFERVTVCYDDGQNPVTNVLRTAFETSLPEEKLVWVNPRANSCRLVQVADYLLDLELVKQRFDAGKFKTTAINMFYGNYNYFRSHYYKQARRKYVE